MKKLLAILLTLAMLFTSYAFAMPASAESTSILSRLIQNGSSGGGSWSNPTLSYTADDSYYTITLTDGNWKYFSLENVESITMTFESAEPGTVWVEAHNDWAGDSTTKIAGGTISAGDTSLTLSVPMEQRANMLKVLTFKTNVGTGTGNIKFTDIVLNYVSSNNSIFSTDGTEFALESKSNDTTWDDQKKLWTPTGGYQNIKFVTENPVSNAISVAFDLATDCTGTQQLYVYYSDGTKTGGYSNVVGKGGQVRIALDPAKSVSGLQFYSGENNYSLTINNVTFESVPSGMKIETVDVTETMSFAADAEHVSYNSATKTLSLVSKGIGTTKAWFAHGAGTLPGNVVSYTVEYASLPISVYATYKNGNGTQVEPYSHSNATSSNVAAQTYGVVDTSAGFTHFGFYAWAAGDVQIKSVKLNCLVNDGEPEPAYLAMVGEQGFETVEKAFIYAAANNGTVKLLTNYTVPELVNTIGVESGKNVGIDLNGYEFSSAHGAVVANGGTLTVTDSTGNANAFNCAINAEGVLNLSGNVDVSNITLASTGSVVATGYTGTATVTLDPAIEAGQNRVVATGNSDGTFISAQGYTVTYENNGTVTFTNNNAVPEPDGITSADNIFFSLKSMHSGSTWDNTTKTWTPPSGYKNIVFETETLVENAILAKVTVTSGCTTGQNMYVVYSNGTKSGGFISITTNSRELVFALDPNNKVSGFEFCSGNTAGYLKIEKIEFEYLPDGKKLESLDITDNLKHSSGANYNSETKTVTYTGWSTAWFNVNVDSLPANIVSFTVEYASLPIGVRTYYKNSANSEIAPDFQITDKVETEPYEASKTYAVLDGAGGFSSFGLLGSAAGNVVIKSVKLNYLADVELAMYGATLELKNDLSIVYYAEVYQLESGLYTDPYISVEANGVTRNIYPEPYIDYSYGVPMYVFKYDNISPAKMGTEFKATIHAKKNGELVGSSQIVPMSIKKYGEDALDGEISGVNYGEPLKSLAKALLNYGTYAQTYIYGSSDVNNALNETQKQVSNPFAEGTEYGCLARTPVEGAGKTLVTWTSASLTLNESIDVNFFFEADGIEGLSAEITYGINGLRSKTVNSDSFVLVNGRYRVKLDEMSAADLSSKISVVLMKDGVAVSERLDYSVLDYAWNMSQLSDSDALKNLLYAIVEYIAAVDNYSNQFSANGGMYSIYDYYGFAVPEIQSFNPSKTYVKHLGRAYYTNDNALWLSYSGSGMEFTFTGTEVSITVQGSDNTANWGESNLPRYAIYIDEELKYDGLLTAASTAEPSRLECKHTFQVDSAEHTVKLIKLSSAGYIDMAVTNISVKADGIISPTAENDLLIEFVGDSITCGCGVDANGNTPEYLSKEEDVSKSYGYIAAQALDADASFVSIGGHGVVSSYINKDQSDGSAATTNLIPKYYNGIGGHSSATANTWKGQKASETAWSFERTADIVVINLGTNDCNYVTYYDGTDEEKAAERRNEFEAAYVEFIQQIRDKNPNAHIICTLGPMNKDLYQNVKNAVETYTYNYDSNVSAYEMSLMNTATEGWGASHHPSAVTQSRVGGEVADYIQSLIDSGVITR